MRRKAASTLSAHSADCQGQISHPDCNAGAIFINLVTQAIGRKPVMIAAITIIPVVIFTMVLGIMSMIVYDKNKNTAGKCDKFDTNIPDLSGIGAMFMDDSDAPPPPRPAVLGMTIGAGVFAILVGVVMYLTKGKV